MDIRIKRSTKQNYGITQNQIVQPGTGRQREGKNWQQNEKENLWEDRRLETLLKTETETETMPEDRTHSTIFHHLEFWTERNVSQELHLFPSSGGVSGAYLVASITMG